MKKILKWIVIIVIALIVIGLIFGGDDADTSTSSTTSDSENVAEVTEPAIEVTAQELFNAYDNNEVAADKQFKGKLLKITGTVNGIDSGISDQAIVKLGTSNDFMSVSAEGDSNFDDQAATLSKGQQVTLLCEGAGEVIGSPMVDKCKFQ